MLTGDLNVAVVEWIVQYRVSDPYEYLFKVRNLEETFHDMNEAVMREVVGDRTVTEVLTLGRQEIEVEVEARLQDLANRYEMGITIDQVVLQDVNPPAPVRPSWDEVSQAQQQRDRMINEARGEYNRVIPRARGEAQQAILQAEGYALDRVNRAQGNAARFTAVYGRVSAGPGGDPASVVSRDDAADPAEGRPEAVCRRGHDRRAAAALARRCHAATGTRPADCRGTRHRRWPMRPTNVIQIAVGVALLLVLGQSLYTVHETEQIIITQFGEPVGDPVVTAGLHFKLPFIQRTNVVDKRFLEWDGNPNQVPTRDRRFIRVDTYARWRITDPLLYFLRLRDERVAQSRLDDVLDGETRNAVARHDLIELVRSTNRNPDDVPIETEEEAVILEAIERGRGEIMREILDTAAGATADLGIELLDLRLKRINYVEEVQQDVFARMIAERQQVAEQFRSEGQGESARINGERERELAEIVSEAYREAEELRGQADAEASRVYAEAYNRDPDFYAFTKSLETYEETMDPSTIFILGTDSELLRFLEQPQ